LYWYLGVAKEGNIVVETKGPALVKVSWLLTNWLAEEFQKVRL